MLSASGSHPSVPEFTWWLSAAQKIEKWLCVSSAPHWPREAAVLNPQVHCVLRGCQGLACSLREEGLEAGPALRAGKAAGSSSVVPEEKLLSDGMLVEAREASEEDLLVVHTRRYLNELKVQYQDLRAVVRSSGWRGRSSALGVLSPAQGRFLR